MVTIDGFRVCVLAELASERLRESGFLPLSAAADDRDVLRMDGDDLLVRGRGTWHEVGAIGTLPAAAPLGLPLRLVVEAICLDEEVGLEAVCRAYAVLQDLKQYQPTAPAPRGYDYQYVLTSTSGFTQRARDFAAAHGIALDDVSGRAWEGLRSTVEAAAAGLLPLLDPASVASVPVSTVRLLLRAALGMLEGARTPPSSARSAVRRRVRAVTGALPPEGALTPQQLDVVLPVLEATALSHQRSRSTGDRIAGVGGGGAAAKRTIDLTEAGGASPVEGAGDRAVGAVGGPTAVHLHPEAPGRPVHRSTPPVDNRARGRGGLATTTLQPDTAPRPPRLDRSTSGVPMPDQRRPSAAVGERATRPHPGRATPPETWTESEMVALVKQLERSPRSSGARRALDLMHEAARAEGTLYRQQVEEFTRAPKGARFNGFSAPVTRATTRLKGKAVDPARAAAFRSTYDSGESRRATGVTLRPEFVPFLKSRTADSGPGRKRTGPSVPRQRPRSTGSSPERGGA